MYQVQWCMDDMDGTPVFENPREDVTDEGLLGELEAYNICAHHPDAYLRVWDNDGKELDVLDLLYKLED